ncbi:MAG TPA: hypothetical protein VGC72_04300 [Candidatus Elarobacter sp.]
MNIIAKVKAARLALLSAVAAALVLQAVPASANNNPTYDLSGIWKSSVGDQSMIFQTKERVVVIAINNGWAQMEEGYYYTPTKVRVAHTRVTRSNGCQVTMSADITVVSNTKFQITATALEAACGLTLGQQYSDNNNTRAL